MGCNKSISYILIFTMIFILSGCAGNSSNQNAGSKSNYPVTVSGVEIKAAPENVVVLSESIADIILAQGYEISLKAKTDDCTQDELEVLPSVGNLENLDSDKIKSLNPDLVLCDKELSSEQTAAISNSNTKIIVLKPATTREEFEELYSNIGKVMGGNIDGAKKGAKSASNILLTLDDFARLTQGSTVTKTAVYLYDNKGSVLTGDTFGSKLIEFAGAINIATDSLDGKMDLQAIKLSNPEYIFCAPGVKDTLKTTELLSELDAIKKNKIYEFEPYMFNRQGRTVIKVTGIMAGYMYPEIANDASSTSSTISSSKSSSSSLSSTPSTINITKNTVIKVGDKGSDVLVMQKRLDELNYMHVAPSGTFSNSTLQAIKDFQFLNGIVVTGVADQETLSLLFSNDAAVREDPARQK